MYKESYIVIYHESDKQLRDGTAIGPFEKCADAQEWTVNQTMDKWPGFFTVLPIRPTSSFTE